MNNINLDSALTSKMMYHLYEDMLFDFLLLEIRLYADVRQAYPMQNDTYDIFDRSHQLGNQVDPEAMISLGS